MSVCARCGSQGIMQCSRCKMISYCGQACQKSDWSTHKLVCGRVEFKHDDEKGRVVVAKRDFIPGEVVFEEFPIAWSPHTTFPPDKLCLGCLRPVFSPYKGAPVETFTCTCGHTFCSEHCAGRKNGFHDTECMLLSGSYDSECCDTHRMILRVRMLGTKLKSLSSWKIIEQLHRCETQAAESFAKSFGTVLQDTLHREVTMDDVLHVTQVESGVAWDLPIRFDAESDSKDGFAAAHWPLPAHIIHGQVLTIGNIIATVEHSCSPNCFPSLWFSQAGPKIICRASSPISRGDHLSLSYLAMGKDLAEPSYLRIPRLLDSKKFTCRCVRCLDSTDGGAFTGSPLCTKCSSFLLPPQAESSLWVCQACNNQEDGNLVNEQISGNIESVRSTFWGGMPLERRRDLTKQLLAILKEQAKTLHRNHYVLFNAHLDLSLFLGMAMEPLSEEDSQTLLRVATSAFEVLEKLYPTCCEDKGLLLLHAARGAIGSQGKIIFSIKTVWKRHFSRAIDLLQAAQRQFQNSVGVDHDLTCCATSLLDAVTRIQGAGSTFRSVDEWIPPSYKPFLGETLCTHYDS